MSILNKKAYINGVDLTTYMQITKIKVPPVADISNKTRQMSKIGLELVETTFGAKVIELDCFIKNDVLSNIDIINSICLGRDLKLSFDDRPDKYFIVTLQDISEPSSRVRNASFTVKFLSYDGQEHSSTFKVITNYTDAGDRLVFNVTNNGNKPAYPIITVRHNTDNGYLGFINQTSFMELGDNEQIDTEIREKSVLLFDYTEKSKTKTIQTALTDGVSNIARLNDGSQILDGTLGIKSQWNRDHIYLASVPKTTGTNHASSITYDLPDASLNEYVWWRQVFRVTNNNQLGFIKINFSDANGDFLYGVETIKRANGLKSEYNFFVSDGKGGYIWTDLRWKFDATHYDTQNPFNPTRGWSDFVRNDDKVSVFWWGSRKTRTFPTIKGKIPTKMHIAIGTFGDKPQVAEAYIDEFKYQIDKVPYRYDIPNTFDEGSTLVLDCERDLAILENVPEADLIVEGYESFPIIPVGSSTFEIYTSSWCTNKPSVQLAFEERW